MIFLHANPMRLSKLEPQREKSPNNQIMIPNFFKSDVIDVLNHRNRVLNVKFEVLTKASLEASINMGCRVLYISSEMISNQGLIIEDADFRPQLFRFEELGQLFTKRILRKNTNSDDSVSSLSHKFKLEFVIIGSRNDAKLAEFFVNELQVPHVIWFEFNEIIEEPFKSKLYQLEYINKFVQFFLNELVAEKKIQESFDNAKKDTIDCLSYSFFNQADENEVSNLLGKGAILLPSEDSQIAKPHSHSLFGSDEFVLQKGKIEDISLHRFSGTISKSILPFFGRWREISYIVDYVMTSSDQIEGFLKISGEEGVGKTRLMLEVAWYLFQRNAFPDGIFYLPLKKVNKMNILSMIETNSEKLGVPLDKNYANYFRKKKMLVIFDDFDIIYSGDVEAPSLLLSIVKKAKIPVIVICKKYFLREAADETSQSMLRQFQETQTKIETSFVSRVLNLPRLDATEISNMTLSLSSTSYKGAMTYKEAHENSALKRTNGLPSRVVEALLSNKLFYKSSPLQILPFYASFQELDRRLWNYFKNERDRSTSQGRKNPLAVSRHSTLFKNEAVFEINSMKALSDEEKKVESSEEEKNKRKTMKLHNMERIKLFNRTATQNYGDEDEKHNTQNYNESVAVLPIIPSVIDETDNSSDIEKTISYNKAFSDQYL